MTMTITHDLRFGARMLLKHPTVTVVAVITLALGIGANSAIFSVVNAVLLRPLPYTDPDRLVALWANVPEHGRWRATPANFLDWKTQNTTFVDMAAYGAWTMTLTGDGEPEQILGSNVSSNYFGVVGVHPVIGRAFVGEEYAAGKNRVVILGDSLWRRRYAADPNIINKAITLNGEPYTVVGVMPRGIYPMWPTTSGHISFELDQQQFWVPMAFSGWFANLRGAHVVGVVGRLKPGVTIAQAREDMKTIAARLELEYPINKGEGIIVAPFMDELVGNVKPALFTLLAGVALVLLIACSNIAGLLLAQHATRSKEIAIRAALGAGRMRIMRQLLFEGALLALLGTVVGIAIARFGTAVIPVLVPQQIPRLTDVNLDWRVLGFTLLLSLFTCLFFGLVPAWQASKTDLQHALEQGRRTSIAAGRQRLRQLLVVFQISMAVLLVISAGLLVKSFWLLQHVDPGFNAEHVLSVGLSLPGAKYAEPDQVNGFFNQLTQRVLALPGVQSAAISYDHPLEASWIDSFSIEGRAPLQPDETQSANFNPVGPDYFRAVGARIVSGRAFTPQDDQDHPGVAIVNEAFVRQYLPHDDVLHQRLKPSPPARIWKNERFTSFQIIGVVRNIKSAGLSAETDPAYYIPASQAPLADMVLLVRTQSDPNSLVSALRQAVWSIDPNQPIANVNTMEKLLAQSIAQPRLNMWLMGLFGVLALVLAAVGIYGLISYSVAQRTQEMGIRMALGAQVRDVLTLILKQGLALALVGEAIGLIAAFAATRLMRGLLFGVAPTDVTVFISVAVVLTSVGMLACYLPARRATKVDPLVALKCE
ncbi:MAG: hypothetical protein C5B55_04640 [Blastocatellia bacterium]|nr:MAG: hypothetical protein C5B55_04640 [Blastocatellia bacterium]